MNQITVSVPDVTVFIPSHRPDLLDEARKSVHLQTHRSFAIATVESPLWWPGKINDAAAAVRSEFMVMLCDDDLLRPTFLERTVAKAKEGYDIVYTDAQTFGRHGSGRARMGQFSREGFVKGNPIWITSLIRTSLWRSLTPSGQRGAFAEDLLYYDRAFWYEAFKHDASAAYIPEVLWDYREDGQNGTNGIDSTYATEQFLTRYPELRP